MNKNKNSLEANNRKSVAITAVIFLLPVNFVNLKLTFQQNQRITVSTLFGGFFSCVDKKPLINTNHQ